MKTRPVGAQLFHAGGWTDRHEANSCFWAILLIGIKMLHLTVKRPRENCYCYKVHQLKCVIYVGYKRQSVPVTGPVWPRRWVEV